MSLKEQLAAEGPEIRCICTEKVNSACPLHGVVIIRLDGNSVQDFAEWGDREPKYLEEP